MKNILFLLLALLIAITSCQQQSSYSVNDLTSISLEEGFKDPPMSVRPKGYWDWMNGNFDLGRLTIELEEGKAQGMAGYDIFDIGAVSNPGGMVGAGPEFMGEECLEAISYAVKEAERLEMELGLILSSSWDAGGSWIKPEHGSMALYESSILVEGPGTHELVLPFPDLPETDRKGKKLLIEKDENGFPEFYKDVAVVAVPSEGNVKFVEFSKVIDLTNKMEASGKLSWDIPEGKWEITRFVCSNTGEPLKVPSPNSTGLSMDHFNPEATDFHFNYFIDRLQEKIGDIGNSPIEYFYLCSYEVVGFVWTPAMLEEFEERRGYDMTPFLPVLQGKTVQSEDITDRFLHDYQKTLSDLLIENLYLRGREIINPYGLKLCSESGGPGAPVHNVPVDALRALGVLDIPRGEFWNKHPRLDENGHDIMQLVKEISCAAHIYGKKEVQGEAFTSFLHWQEGPRELKPLADLAMCEGLTRFIYHTSPHTTPDAGIPGYVYHAGTHFNSSRVWWPKSRAFTDYLARSCFLLQQGNFVGDVLYYYGDQAPNFVKPKHENPSLGPGFDYDVTNSEVLLTRMDVEDNRLVLPDGQSYEILVLPDQDHASLEVLEKLEELVSKGATIVGRKPSRSHGLNNYAERDAAIIELANKLWGDCDGMAVTENPYGKGRVIWGRTLKQVLSERGLEQDFAYTHRKGSTKLDFIHRRTDGKDIYFVSNTGDEKVSVDAMFRVSNKSPEFWDPETGNVSSVALFSVEGSHTNIPMSLGPHGSQFVVFNDNNPLHLVSLVCDEAQIFPDTADIQTAVPIFEVRSLDEKLSFITRQKGSYILRDSQGKDYYLEIENIPSSIPVTGEWKIDFPSGWGAPEQVIIPELISWTESKQEGVKYFSGIASYHKIFTLPGELVSDDLLISLDLGMVKEVAEIYLNGKSLGILWKPPYRVEISDHIQAGENELVVEVANTWSNRLTGDGLLPEADRYTKTNITGPNFQTTTLWKDAPLLESGLLGPVSIEFSKELKIN